MAISGFSNLRWSVSETARLSISSWEECGKTHYSVGLFRKRANRWQLDHETVVEFAGEKRKDVAFKATDYGYSLVTKELGYAPERFFRGKAA